jgi:hypothetical protein
MADTTLKVTEAVVGTNLAAVTFVNGNGDTVKATEVTIISETGANISPLTDAQLRASSVPISGTVAVSTLPALPAGTNNIGTVAVSTLPALPAGTNNIGDVGILSVIPGTGATNLGKQADSPAGATDTGVAILAIRDDVPTTLVPADGDYTRVRVNSVGRLWASATIDTALPAGTNTIGFVIEAPSTLGVNSTGAAAAAVTLTLPAPGAGLFQYVDSVEITLYNSAARTGGATPVTVTSTNLPGTPTWLFPSAGAIGTRETYSLITDAPVRASTANTAVTIVCPAVTGGIWNVKALYRTGA